MKKPLVSVVMPARDCESTLPEALGSIQKQDYDNCEIIVVDHRSKDSTPSILSRAAAEDPRIQHVRFEGSFVEAANLAWQQSSGELIARMDSDDVAHPSRISSQVAYLTGNPDLDACGTLVRIQKRGSERGEIIPADGGYSRYESWVNSVRTPDEIEIQRFVDSPVPNPTMMIRRETLAALGGYRDPSWAEDYDFWLRFLEAGYRVSKVPEILLDWFDSPDRSTRTIPRYEQDQFQRAKAAFLSQLAQTRSGGVCLWGAGPIGKQMAKLLHAEEISVHAFVEVNKKKIGKHINRVPVLSPAGLSPPATGSVLLSAVGNANAREQIREFATSSGYVEGDNFFCIA